MFSPTASWGWTTFLWSCGWIACLAATSAAGIVEREPEAQSIEKTSRDSLYRSDSCRAISGVDADAASLPQQTAALELQWPGGYEA